MTQKAKEMPPSESDLDSHAIRAVLAGDAGAFNELVERYERRIYNLAYRMTGNAADAADLAQEIFIHLHKKLASFRGEAAFSTWFYRLATNVCKDWLRKGSRQAQTLAIEEATLPDGGEGPGGLVERKEMQALVQSAILALPEDQRIAVILHDLQGYRYEEIAAVVGVPVGTVKSRLARARAKLAEALAPVVEQKGTLSV